MGKRTIFFIALIFVSGLMITTAGAVPVIIGFKDKAHPEMIQPYGKVTHSYKYIPAVAADLPEQAIENLKKNKNIAYIEQDLEVKALGETLPWGIEKIRAPQVHESDNKGTGVNVAIIDTGIYHTHPDLIDNYKGGYDFVNNDDDPMDDNGHGTHCAGIIAAIDNEIGVIGVAPEANLYALKILDSTGSGSSSDLIAAIEWAIDTHKDTDQSNNIQIISMSLGSNLGDLSLQGECSKAYYDYGILLVAAAGNDGKASGVGDTVDYPAAYSSVIAVAATDSTDKRASFSSTGPAVELAAPGVNIFSTYLGGYASASGTSMACPHVAGTAALVLYANPSFTNDDIREKLKQTATDLGTSGWDTLYGFGRVNAEAAAIVSAPDENTPPVAEANGPYSVTVENPVYFSSEGSYDPDGSVVAYEWDFGDETENSFEQNPSHTYSTAGTYTVTLTVTDNENAVGTDTATVEVTEASSENKIHISEVNVETSSRKAGKNIFASATAVVKILDSSNSPVEGATISGYWSGATSDIDYATTNNEGTVTVYSDEVKYKSGTLTFTFTVDGVSHEIPWDEKEKQGTGTYP